MALTCTTYGHFPEKISNKEIDYVTDDIKIMLCTDSYVPNQDTDEYKSDVTNEISISGYTSGGKILTSKSITYNSKITTLISGDVVWTLLTGEFRYAVIYCDTGVASTSALISYIDFGSTVTTTLTDVTITWDSGEMLTFSVV